MNSFRFFIATLGFIFLVGVGTKPTFADEEKTMEQYWQETGLQFSSLEKLLNDNFCWLEENSFTACYHGINAILNEAEKPQVLVAKSRTSGSTKPDYLGKEEKNFNSFVSYDVEAPKTSEKLTPFQYYQKVKAERKATLDSLLALFKAKDKTAFSFSAMLEYAKKLSVNSKNEAGLTARALNKMMGNIFDPHTYIQPVEYSQAVASRNEEVFYGIGAVLEKKGEDLVVKQPMENSPAFNAGVYANDVIVSIDGVSVKGKPLDESIKLIKGAEGTKVKLGLLRKGKGIDLVVTRGKVVTANVQTKILSTNTGKLVGYIKHRSFSVKSSCDEIKKSVTSMELMGVSGYILDLRDNLGGYVDQSICIAGIFLPKGSLVMQEKMLTDQNGSDKNYYTEEEPLTSKPMVTLINAESASASEILSGAFQDHQRSVLMGERSYGKATVQQGFGFQSNSKIYWMRTIARFYQPSGRTNQIRGILPDVEVFSVPNATEEDKFAWREEDIYDNALPALGAEWKQPRPEYMKVLNFCMKHTGSTDSDYKKGMESGQIPPDYVVLNATDAVNCMAPAKNTTLTWNLWPSPLK